MSEESLSVAAIVYGTVIDHLPCGKGLKLVELLHLTAQGQKVTLGLNLPSKSMGCKDLVKVEGRVLSDEEIAVIAIFAPTAHINVIENCKVSKKFPVKLPQQVRKVFSCPNPTCITNHEAMVTRFNIFKRSKQVELSCHYCEKSFSHDAS